MSWGTGCRRSRGHTSARRRASLAAVLLCLLAWLPLPLGLAAGHVAAGWTEVCSGKGVTTVLLEDSGGRGEHRDAGHCTQCWGQAPEHDMPVLAATAALFEIVTVDDDFPVREAVFPRALFRFQIRSRAPPALA